MLHLIPHAVSLGESTVSWGSAKGRFLNEPLTTVDKGFTVQGRVIHMQSIVTHFLILNIWQASCP